MAQNLREIQTIAERRMLRALASVVNQFFAGKDDHGLILWHNFLSAGERSFASLEEFGVIEPRDKGGGWTWTELGKQIRSERYD